MIFHHSISWRLPLSILLILCALSASALTNDIALTPQMGWNDWNSYGCGISESAVTNNANIIAASGLQAAGYCFINLDDGWASSRDSNGIIQPYSLPTKFPDGIHWLADHVHSMGLKLGIYTDHGTNTCSSCISGETPPKQPGSYGYEYVDAFTYAQWGVDYLKNDSCNLPAGDNPQADYFRMADGLLKSGQPILNSLCPNAAHYEYWSPDVGNSWRTTGDIQKTFASMISKIDQNSKSAYLAGPGRWNDPDMLEIGNGEFATNLVAAQTHFSMWCIMAAPLIMGNNLTIMSAQTLVILTNAEAIAVDQDPAGEQGERVGGIVDNAEVWSKPLGYDFTTRAVALLNRNTNSSATVTCNWTNLALQAGTSATVRDLWSHQDLGTFTNSFTTTIPPYGSMLLKIVGTPLPPPAPGTNYLTSLQPVYAYCGFGSMTNNVSIIGNPITLNGQVYTHGIGTHAIGGNEYILGGVCSRFHATIGVDDEVGANGSVIFQVIADGRKIYDSGIMTGGATAKTIDLDMTGVRRLTIGVTDTGNDVTGNRNSNDHADWANAFVVVTNAVPQTPETPVGLAVSAGSAIKLTWNDSLAALTYNVKRAVQSSGPYTAIANVPLTTFTDTNVVNGTTYFYVISALSSLGESPDSAYVSAAPCTVPSTPVNITSSTTNSLINLQWTASPGATSYTVERFTRSTPPVILASGLNTAGFTDTNVVQGTIYYYLVAAANTCNQSPFSAFVAVASSAPPVIYSSSYWTNTTTGSQQSWDANANWTNTAVFPNAPGAAAMIAANIGADQTIALDQIINLGALLIGDTDGSSRYTIVANGGGLVFNGGTNDGYLGQLTTSRGDVIAAPITIVNNLDVANNSINPLEIAGDISGSAGSLNLLAGTLQIGDGATSGSLGLVNVVDNGSLVFDRSDNVTVAGAISGSGSLTQTGSGILTLGGANTFAGGVTVQNGTLLAANASSLGSAAGITLVTNGGTLDIDAQSLVNEMVMVSGVGVGGNGAIVNSGAQQTKALRNVTLTGDTTIGGAAPWNPNGNLNRWDIRANSTSSTNGCFLSTGGHPYKLSKIGGNQISIVAAAVDPALGDIDIQQGLMGWETMTSSMGNAASNIIVRAGATLSFYNATTAWNKHFILYGNGASTNMYNWSGANTVIGPVQLNGACVFWGGGTSLFLSNVVSGPGALIKNGTYNLLLAGTNTYAGNTTVNGGTLTLTGNGSVATSPIINVGAGATLDASGRNDTTLAVVAGQMLTGAGSIKGIVSVGAAATLAPGGNIGTLSVNGNLVLNSGSVTVMEINKGVVPSNDVAQVSGSVTYGGTLMITNRGAVTFAAGDSFKLFNAANYSGAFTSIAPVIPGINLAWNTNSLTNGILSVVASPTPPPKFAALSFNGDKLVFSGSNGVPGWTYYLLASTNLGQPLGNWMVVSSNIFDGSGGFILTNPGSGGAGQNFYLLKLQ